MNFPISISRTSLSPILGVLVGIFHFYSNSYRTLCEQTVETLIRHPIMRHLIWVCPVCLCPTKRTLGLYGLHKESYVKLCLYTGVNVMPGRFNTEGTGSSSCWYWQVPGIYQPMDTKTWVTDDQPGTKRTYTGNTETSSELCIS